MIDRDLMNQVCSIIYLLVSIIFGFCISFFNVHVFIYESLYNIEWKIVLPVFGGQVLIYSLLFFYPLSKLVKKMTKEDEDSLKQYNNNVMMNLLHDPTIIYQQHNHSVHQHQHQYSTPTSSVTPTIN
ncbi:hypothetical protein DFA_04738 [Cavenderia fasciculata]|uniref:Transmembrane protein n=1 Tax=Cavenderia fasciculata TaxID=261658 RepID=F4PQE5_CACFS|nr:uncharacterized protein DFA_04738 [Cavenderia fasciculata]EGG22608.1 hypothetical protein DFA_04738 [Cavenderia fasciculata]|eukprot:XP_004360459.1 hypothetical protein DFA_04738 [Cavenderia fasciculata]